MRSWPPVTAAIGAALLAVVGCSADLPEAGPRTPRPLVTGAVDPAHDVELVEIAPDVWVHTSWSRLPDGTWFPSNGMLVRDGAQLLLVDTAWGDAATVRLLELIEERIGQPVTRALATHFHDDRVGGARALRAQHVPLSATPPTRTLAAATLDAEGLAAFDRDLPLLREGEATTVGAVEVFHPGAGHAPDNVVVWVPSARVLFGGCAVKAADAEALGNLQHADVGSWFEAIARIAARYGAQAKLVVPGHGAPGGRALLDHTRDLLADAATIAARMRVTPTTTPAPPPLLPIVSTSPGAVTCERVSCAARSSWCCAREDENQGHCASKDAGCGDDGLLWKECDEAPDCGTGGACCYVPRRTPDDYASFTCRVGGCGDSEPEVCLPGSNCRSGKPCRMTVELGTHGWCD